MSLPDNVDWRYLAPWVGVVTHIEDPEGLHRIRARIPGLMNLTSWAYPITAGGGSAQYGGHIVPPVGSDVIIQFMGGEQEYPLYSAAHWGRQQTPQSILDAGSQAHLVQALQMGDLLITYDGRERGGEGVPDGEGQLFTIKDLKANKVILTYDLHLQGWDIQSDYMIRLKTLGPLILDGLQTQVSGRVVKRGTSSKI